MVALLYALIIVPILFYIVFTIFEILSFYKTSLRPKKTAPPYTQATLEITHTLLVYAVTIFMTSHAELLPAIGATLYLPIAILMATLLVRAILYYLVFYGTPRALYYQTFVATYLIGLVATVWTVVIVITHLLQTQFVPNTENTALVATVGAVALLICIFPMIEIYKTAIGHLKKQ